jgi:excisionase family DNA binding protein
MAGIFYSLQEVAQRLHKSDDEIKDMVKAGKLREFRDGSNVLFKVDEVDALMKQNADADFEQLMLADTNEPITVKEDTKGKTPSKPENKLDDSIFLADDTAGSKADLINADTAMISDGLNLSETAGGADKLDDLMEATRGDSGKTAGKGEGDINLDSFGSGGLLDLSLQADDTSLGGILDEIYTSESAEATPTAKAASSMEEEIKAGEILEASKQTMETAVVMPAHIEVKPDLFSNALGLSLLIPLLATIFTIIIVATGFNLPSILRVKSGMFDIYIGWIIMGGLAVTAMLIIGGGAILGSLGSKGEAKPKEKKEKPPKPPKEKKSKKDKKDNSAKA